VYVRDYPKYCWKGGVRLMKSVPRGEMIASSIHAMLVEDSKDTL
jgi:hypothetical protein